MFRKISKLGWYWRRLQAMNPAEVALRLQKRAYQFSDAQYTPYAEEPGPALEPRPVFPLLPDRREAPPELLAGLAEETEEILRGEWSAFGHLPLPVGDPPRWQRDHLAGLDFHTVQSAFKLDHRAKPGGADIKVIWEPNRWYQLVRLAMASWLLDHGPAREKCAAWLGDWARANPPFLGLNWTSGLETGLRLVQFTWIDSLLEASGVPRETLHDLRARLLPAHVRYTWRYRSFGSSANNHLIGELAGLILALVRWPQLEKVAAPLERVTRALEREVLAQFAPDGGNLEQAHGYHLFSWEFCWQAQRALSAAGAGFAGPVVDRLIRAGEFYALLKPEGDVWDYGDSDNAWVTPLFARAREQAGEWWRWFDGTGSSPALRYWWGTFPGQPSREEGVWRIFPNTGMAVMQAGDWFARFDFSPLGYLSMAPHGHLDALHVSLWFRGQPVIIDPGTGAYYADPAARNYLAGWTAHNSPQLKDPPMAFPKRFGTFLWGTPHSVPRFALLGPDTLRAELGLPYGRMIRTVRLAAGANSVQIEDRFVHREGQFPVVTRWKFAPGWLVQNSSAGQFQLASPGGAVLKMASTWKMSRSYNPPEDRARAAAPVSTGFPDVPLDALVAPAFRRLGVSSYLALESAGEGPFQLTLSPG